MPQNCSADVQAVIQYVDQVFTSEDSQKIQETKDLFGMGDVMHLDDVSGACKDFSVMMIKESLTSSQCAIISGTGRSCNLRQAPELPSSSFVMHLKSRTENQPRTPVGV